MVLDMIIAQVSGECSKQESKNDTSVFLFFLSFFFFFFFCMSPDPYITLFSFPEHNFAVVKNIFMVLGRIIEQVYAEYRMREC